MKKKIVYFVSLGICSLSLIILIVYLAYPYLKPDTQKSDLNISEPSQVVSSVPEELPENPIDFTALKEQNTDIVAWINIPGTKVDYPVLQSGEGTEEDFYLYHNANRNYEFAGSIYMQKINNFDFSDPNTVLYGHNMLNGSMFASLHKFKDADFFNSNRYIYVYTPEHILTYEIFSAYRYDNRHLLYYFNFNDKQVFEEYLKTATSPTDSISNIRKDINVTSDDKIITLSTCITNDNYRYLVQGVLTDDQPTKQ